MLELSLETLLSDRLPPDRRNQLTWVTLLSCPFHVHHNTEEHRKLKFSFETLPSNRLPPDRRSQVTCVSFSTIPTLPPPLMHHIAQSIGFAMAPSATRPNQSRPSLHRRLHKPTAPVYMTMFLTALRQDVFGKACLGATNANFVMEVCRYFAAALAQPRQQLKVIVPQAAKP